MKDCLGNPTRPISSGVPQAAQEAIQKDSSKDSTQKPPPSDKKVGPVTAHKSRKSLRDSFYHISKPTAFRATMGINGMLATIAVTSMILSSLVLATVLDWIASINTSMEPFCQSSALATGCLALDPSVTLPWNGFVAWSAVLLISTFLAFHGSFRCARTRAHPPCARAFSSHRQHGPKPLSLACGKNRRRRFWWASWHPFYVAKLWTTRIRAVPAVGNLEFSRSTARRRRDHSAAAGTFPNVRGRDFRKSIPGPTSAGAATRRGSARPLRPLRRTTAAAPSQLLLWKAPPPLLPLYRRAPPPWRSRHSASGSFGQKESIGQNESNHSVHSLVWRVRVVCIE